MNIPKPNKFNFTIYSKSNCSYCKNTKNLLEGKSYEFELINCDEFILKNREEFINEMKQLITPVEKTTFPFVFYNAKFLGGFTETIQLIKQFEINNDFITF